MLIAYLTREAAEGDRQPAEERVVEGVSPAH